MPYSPEFPEASEITYGLNDPNLDPNDKQAIEQALGLAFKQKGNENWAAYFVRKRALEAATGVLKRTTVAEAKANFETISKQEQLEWRQSPAENPRIQPYAGPDPDPEQIFRAPELRQQIEKLIDPDKQ